MLFTVGNNSLDVLLPVCDHIFVRSLCLRRWHERLIELLHVKEIPQAHDTTVISFKHGNLFDSVLNGFPFGKIDVRKPATRTILIIRWVIERKSYQVLFKFAFCVMSMSALYIYVTYRRNMYYKISGSTRSVNLWNIGKIFQGFKGGALNCIIKTFLPWACMGYIAKAKQNNFFTSVYMFVYQALSISLGLLFLECCQLLGKLPVYIILLHIYVVYSKQFSTGKVTIEQPDYMSPNARHKCDFPNMLTHKNNIQPFVITILKNQIPKVPLSLLCRWQQRRYMRMLTSTESHQHLFHILTHTDNVLHFQDANAPFSKWWVIGIDHDTVCAGVVCAVPGVAAQTTPAQTAWVVNFYSATKTRSTQR